MKSNYQAQLPTDILLSKKLTCFQKILYSYICGIINKDGSCTKQNNHFSKILNKSTNTISKNIAVLINKKFLTVKNPNTSGRRLYNNF